MENLLRRCLALSVTLPARLARWQSRRVPGTAPHIRSSSSSPSLEKVDLKALLARPTWSVRSLLPSDGSMAAEAPISSQQLHHLLRLSALPLPKTPQDEARMIGTLQSQLHFVRDIQSVDTNGVEPLRSIRDETEEGMAETTIGLDDLRAVLANETVHGHNKRPRMDRRTAETKGIEDWDVLGTAQETAGKYFVVRAGKSAEDM